MYTDGNDGVRRAPEANRGTGAAQNRAARLPSLLAAQILTRIVDGVLAFTKGTAQGDDMTLVVVGVKPEAGI